MRLLGFCLSSDWARFSLNSFRSIFTLMFKVIVCLNHLTPTELYPVNRHPDIILQDILINTRIHFPLDGREALSIQSSP